MRMRMMKWIIVLGLVLLLCGQVNAAEKLSWNFTMFPLKVKFGESGSLWVFWLQEARENGAWVYSGFEIGDCIVGFGEKTFPADRSTDDFRKWILENIRQGVKDGTLTINLIKPEGSGSFPWEDKNALNRYKWSQKTSKDLKFFRAETEVIGSPATVASTAKAVNAIIYTTVWCKYCKQAKALLTSLGVNLIEYDIEKDRSKKVEMLKKTGGKDGVPVIDIEGVVIQGYNPNYIKKVVESKRSSS
jgi:glutaredoxin